jgi:hypothetical protein
MRIAVPINAKLNYFDRRPSFAAANVGMEFASVWSTTDLFQITVPANRLMMIVSVFGNYDLISSRGTVARDRAWISAANNPIASIVNYRPFRFQSGWTENQVPIVLDSGITIRGTVQLNIQNIIRWIELGFVGVTFDK